MNVILLFSKSQFERIISTQKFLLTEPNFVTLLLSQHTSTLHQSQTQAQEVESQDEAQDLSQGESQNRSQDE